MFSMLSGSKNGVLNFISVEYSLQQSSKTTLD